MAELRMKLLRAAESAKGNIPDANRVSATIPEALFLQ